MSKLMINNISKVFDKGIESVAEINVEIFDNELFGIIGIEGSGKSTLLRMIAGMESVSQGVITLDGEDITYADIKSRDIVMINSAFLCYPQLSVRDNLGYALKLRKKNKEEIEQIISEVALRFGLYDKLNCIAKKLSLEEQIKLALCRVIIRKPKLVILDEPLRGLSEDKTREMAEIIKQLNREVGITFLYVPTNAKEGLSICDRVMMLDRGQVLQVGSPSALSSHPYDLRVSAYATINPMNLIEGNWQSNKVTILGQELECSNVMCEQNNIPIVASLPVDGFEIKKDGILGQVVLIEQEDEYNYLHVSLDYKYNIIMRVDECNYSVGDYISVGIKEEKIHCFNKENLLPLSGFNGVNYINATIQNDKLFVLGIDCSSVLERLIFECGDNVLFGIDACDIKIGHDIYGTIIKKEECGVQSYLEVMLTENTIVRVLLDNECEYGEGGKIGLSFNINKAYLYKISDLSRITSKSEFGLVENMILDKSRGHKSGIVSFYERIGDKTIIRILCANNEANGLFEGDMAVYIGKKIKFKLVD